MDGMGVYVMSDGGMPLLKLHDGMGIFTPPFPLVHFSHVSCRYSNPYIHTFGASGYTPEVNNSP